MKWQYDPDIMTTERLIPSYDIPMPALTICSQLLVKKYKLDFLKIYLNNSLYRGDENDSCYPPLAELCSSGLGRSHKKAFQPERLKSCLPTASEVFYSCRMAGKLYDCKNAISVLSAFVNCFSFNTMNMEDQNQNWTLSDGYINQEVQSPPRATSANSLSFIMPMDHEDKSNICFRNWRSYLVLFHLPNEQFAILHPPETFVELGQSKKIILNAKMTKTGESLRSYTPEQRRCYFDGE